MVIKKISVENFTVFEKTVVNFCDGINVLIGENATGKTHLLKLLYTFCKAANSRNKEIWVRAYPMFLDRYFLFAGFYLDNDTIIKINDDTVYDYKLLRSNANKPEPDGFEFDEGIGFDSEVINSVFIPAKEMLSMSNIIRLNEKYSRALNIEHTLLDVIKQAQSLKPDFIPNIAKSIAPILEKTINGTVFVNPVDNTFWVKKTDGSKIPFSMEAEGFRKLGLIWQLLMNESITNGTILFWDEPEANINPKLVSVMVEIFLELSRQGVQIFLATHDYILAKYFEVRRNEHDAVLFHSMYITDEGVKCESDNDFRNLTKNPIISAFDELMDEVITGNLGD